VDTGWRVRGGLVDMGNVINFSAKIMFNTTNRVVGIGAAALKSKLRQDLIQTKNGTDPAMMTPTIVAHLKSKKSNWRMEGILQAMEGR
jgi:hypothetical protein